MERNEFRKTRRSRLYEWIAKKVFPDFPSEKLEDLGVPGETFFADRVDRRTSPNPQHQDICQRIETETVRREFAGRVARKFSLGLAVVGLGLYVSSAVVTVSVEKVDAKLTAWKAERQLKEAEKEAQALAAAQKKAEAEKEAREAEESAARQMEYLGAYGDLFKSMGPIQRNETARSIYEFEIKSRRAPALSAVLALHAAVKVGAELPKGQISPPLPDRIGESEVAGLDKSLAERKSHAEGIKEYAQMLLQYDRPSLEAGLKERENMRSIDKKAADEITAIKMVLAGEAKGE